MLALQIDFADVQRVAQNMRAAEDQIPFAMMRALDEATQIARKHLITVWPTKIVQRNASFIAAALTTKDARASKQSLATEIYDKFAASGRDAGHLMMQAKGGVRTPKGRGHMTVPSSNIRKGARGVPANLRPRQLGSRLFSKKGNPDRLYVKDRSGRLRLMYVLKTATKIPKRVPFFEDYQTVMSRELNRLLPIMIEKAMATRR
jgi:hypothetical protein